VGSEPWFIAPTDEWRTSEVTLPPDESHHALRVMRVSPPDVITVTDGAGRVARAAVKGDVEGRLIAEILEQKTHRPPRPRLVVYQGAAKGHKVDDVVERLAELGTAETWVYSSSRSVVHWDEDKAQKRGERWRTIARSAAKQSRNPFVMQTGAALSWTELVRRVAREQLPIVLWEEAELPLRTALLKAPDRIALVVGPEGGLTREEAEELATAGAQLVSLGPRILRTENAPVVAASALLWHYGVIG
jgi:16S rRNA (uracil1498-N3)-methyltransferase